MEEKIVYECHECGCKVDEDEVYSYGDYDYCGDCYDSLFFECEACGNMAELYDSRHIDIGDYTICEDCYHSGDYVSCWNCGEVGHIDDMVYNERDDNWYCRDCYRDSCDKLFEYHSGNSGGDKSEGYRYRVGFEVEKEDIDYLESVGNPYDVLNSTGWCLEEDSSLDDYSGFEAISPMYPLKITTLKKVFESEEVATILSSDYSDSCGGHTTISDTKRTPQQILDDIEGYLPILYALFPHRTYNSYCRPKKKTEYYERDRSAMNIRRNELGGGLEIRLFDTPRNGGDLLNRCRILKFMLQHKAQTIDEALKHLSDNERLRGWIKRHIDQYSIDPERFYKYIIKYSEEIEGLRVKTKINKLPKLRKEDK